MELGLLSLDRWLLHLDGDFCISINVELRLLHFERGLWSSELELRTIDVNIGPFNCQLGL